MITGAASGIGAACARVLRDRGWRTAGIDLNDSATDLPATLEVWDEALAHAPLPLSPIEVPWLPVPGGHVAVDLWVHVPKPAANR